LTPFFAGCNLLQGPTVKVSDDSRTVPKAKNRRLRRSQRRNLPRLATPSSNRRASWVSS